MSGGREVEGEDISLGYPALIMREEEEVEVTKVIESEI